MAPSRRALREHGGTNGTSAQANPRREPNRRIAHCDLCSSAGFCVICGPNLNSSLLLHHVDDLIDQQSTVAGTQLEVHLARAIRCVPVVDGLPHGNRLVGES